MDQFKDLQATQLLCPRCRVAQPVRQRLLLVLPDGDLYEYICAKCGESLGKRKVRAGNPQQGAPPAGPGRPQYM